MLKGLRDLGKTLMAQCNANAVTLSTAIKPYYWLRTSVRPCNVPSGVVMSQLKVFAAILVTHFPLLLLCLFDSCEGLGSLGYHEQ